MKPVVAIVATLDTKGEEADFLRKLIHQHDCDTMLMDVGTLHPPMTPADVSREQVSEQAGVPFSTVEQRQERRFAVETMIRGGAALSRSLVADKRLSGIIALGGGTGTHIGMGIMRGLPLGLPKLMVSTVASRDMRELIGTKDIAVMHSVVDILGLNPISRALLTNAAGSICGMVKATGPIVSEKPIIGMTSFGFITEGAMKVKHKLEQLGFEVAPFHANGTGGMAMEDLIGQGLLHGVMDFALHEFADQLYSGYCGGIGPTRLEAAARAGIPQVVVPGGLDCIVLEFSSPETMPPAVKGRKVFWYDFRSGVRTSPEDVRKLAETIARKLNQAKGPVCFAIPMLGWSEADCVSGPLHEPETNHLFVTEIRNLLRTDIEVLSIDAHINDEQFADVVTLKLRELMNVKPS
jgi:uncharacterized protein (UPF0261 family)